MGKKIVWQPNEGVQTEFHTREEFEVFYGGACGGGKTQSLLIEGLRQVDNPNYKAILFRRTFPELQEHIDRSRQLFPLFDPGAKWNEQKKRWLFSSGAVYRFGHLKNEGDEYQYQTDEYQYIAFDELTHFSERMYMYLHTRCRSSDPTLKCYIRAASNPGNIGHLWVKKRFIDPAPPFTPISTDYNTGNGEIITLERCFIPAKIADNPYIFKNDPGYIARIMANPDPIMREMLLSGDWDKFTGQAFPEWNPERHIVEPFEIPKGWERFRAYDYGKEAPFCMLFFAVDQDGNVFVYREIYEAGIEVTEQARMIQMASPEEEMYYITLADPSIWSSVGIRVHISPTKSGESIGEIFALLGISMVPGDNDRLSGKAQIHRFLSSGKLKIFKNCHNLIRTLPTLPRDERRIEDVSTRAEDHAYDALRYGLMSRPMPGVDPNAVDSQRQELTIHQKCMATVNRKRRSRSDFDDELGDEF